jgi:hypothetical protein
LLNDPQYSLFFCLQEVWDVDIEVWFYLTTILIVEVGALTVSNPMEVHRALFFSFEVEVWLLMFRVYDVDISLLKPIGST